MTPYSCTCRISVWLKKKGLLTKIPTRANTKALAVSRKTPLAAMVLALSYCFCPRVLDKKALIPTAVPTATAIIRDWMGKARDTARSACSSIRDTKMLSTILYRACTSMEIIMGRDMVIRSLSMDITPILFSFLSSVACAISFVLHCLYNFVK